MMGLLSTLLGKATKGTVDVPEYRDRHPQRSAVIRQAAAVLLGYPDRELIDELPVLEEALAEVGVDLRSSFSNPRKPLGSLISRVLRGSRARRPRTRGAQIADERGPVRENSRQSQTRLSVSNRAELIAGYADGVPVRELATRFNVHRGTVREIARQAGLAARRPELPDATRQDAAQLYAGGLTLAQVAARLAVSTEAVRSAVIASGGTIRAGGRRRVGA